MTSGRPGSVVDEIGKLASHGHWDAIIDKVRSDPQILVVRDQFGGTVLHRVVPFGGATETVRFMVENGADVNAIDKSGVSPLGAAISGGHKYGLTTDANVQALIDGGADLNVVAQNGHPPLHWAILERKTSIVRLLLTAGADPRKKNIYEQDAFDVAAETRSPELKDLLRTAS
jgi:ankyrin repeat protein